MTKLEPTRTSSDLTATDRLRELLDERGADYRVSATGYSIDIGPYTTAYANRSNTTLDVSLRQVTPEQAIAATLGRGMLTADDVRDLIERHSDASGGNGRDFHNGAYVAIADELNATLGSFNCSNDCTNNERTTTVDEVERIGISWQDGRHVTVHVMECSECGGTYEHVNGGYEFCPRCGRRIEVD